ncbi:hypothetical protein ABW20_dc0101991 [Dactylellina cionopaga]|nr:hypothetical protein ABW20_dc0101991 [Dactylellina cionopaga]
MESDDEDFKLSASTLSALQEFMQEKDARQKRFEELKTQAEADDEERKKPDAKATSVTMEDFEADWNASQFWYDEETSRVRRGKGSEEVNISEVTTMRFFERSKIRMDADISLIPGKTPSVFVKLKNLMKTGQVPKCNIHLLEYDNRFAIFGSEFTFYDFNEPLRLPLKLKGSFDRILVDPPFLSEDCQTKAAITVRWLAKDSLPVGDHSDRPDGIGLRQEDPRVIVCTGERMANVVDKVYSKAGVKCTEFEVRHAQGLSNEFRCYSNFESERFKWAES